MLVYLDRSGVGKKLESDLTLHRSLLEVVEELELYLGEYTERAELTKSSIVRQMMNTQMTDLRYVSMAYMQR